MMKKATWICGFSLLLAGAACAQYVSDVAAETTDAAIENQPVFTTPEVKDYEFNDQPGYEGTVRVGDWFSGLDSTNNACLVIPFRLPDAGIVANPFTSAQLEVFLQENTLLPASVIDLYVVRTAPSNTVLSSDYYQGSAEGNGTRVVPDFISSSTVASNIISSTDAALLNELNTAYANGAGAGDYVFFRLNHGVDGWAPQNDRCVIAVRSNIDSGKWPRLTLTDNVDQDADGLPDTWEILYSLDPTDDGTLDPDQGPDGDPDFDLLTNTNELLAGTNPSLDDTDGDGLTDGDEVNIYFTDPLDFDSDDDYLSDGDEITNSTDPLDIDSDNDNVNDGTEVSCGSDPNNAGDVPANTLPQMIGADFFDYANNPTNTSIWSLNGGEFFDVDNNINNDSYVGHTCDISDWYDTSFNAGDVVNQGLLTSGDNLALRAFNGINIGGMTLGVFSTDPATGSTSSNLYFKVKMTQNGTVNYAGVSFYNGGDERLFFGKTGGNGFWGIDGADLAAAVTETYGPTNNVEYAIVGKIDISSASVTFWVDPVIASGEGSATPIATSVLGGVGPWTYNAIRLASGGTGSIRWDDLVLAYTWAGLDFGGTDSDSDSLRDTWELIWTTNLTNLAAGSDFDSDTLNDEVELTLLTDPTSTDSDGDGIDDGVEVSTYFTDPAVADTDGDGLSDGFEVTTSGTNNIYITDPLDADSDDDLYTDGEEVAAGTDPNNPTDNPGAGGTIIVNGSKDPLYGAPVAVQTIETGFGDNFSELNAAYTFSTNGELCVMLTGNLEANGNTLEIFIDSTDGVTNNVLDAVGIDNVNNMDGLTFDTGFEPDYHIWFKAAGGGLNMYVSDLVTSNTSTYADIFGGTYTGFALTGTNAANATPIAVGFDNSNVAGVGGTTGVAADTNAAIAVTTGMELCIALSDIGDPPTGTIKIAAFINNDNHNYLANQTLGGLPVGTGNLGGDGAGNFTGTASGIDFNSFAGDQFFTVNVDAGGVVVGPFDITSIQLINANTDVQLILNGLAIGQDYKIQDSVDLTAGFTDVGSPFTATNETAHTVVLPADTGAQPERFFQGAVAP